MNKFNFERIFCETILMNAHGNASVYVTILLIFNDYFLLYLQSFKIINNYTIKKN